METEFKRIRVMRSYRALSHFYQQVTERERWISAHHVRHIPSPYSYSPTRRVLEYEGWNVIVVETAQRRFEVFVVPEGVTIHDTDQAAEAELIANT